MIIYHKSTPFSVMNNTVFLYSEELNNGIISTVAEMNNEIHYLGDESVNIATAILAWQEIMGRNLTSEEVNQVMIDNNLISQGV